MAIISVEVERSHLRAALVVASAHDIRYYLNGVCIEVFRDRCFLVATDGRRMAVLRDDSPEARLPADASEAVRFIIPRELLDKIKASAQDPKIGISYDTESRAVTIKDGITQSTKSASDGAYPDFRRAFPDQLSNVPEQIAPENSGDFAKIARILGCRSSCSVLIFHNGPTDPSQVGGSNVVEIEGHPEFLGLIVGSRDVRRVPRIDRAKFLARSVDEEAPSDQTPSTAQGAGERMQPPPPSVQPFQAAA